MASNVNLPTLCEVVTLKLRPDERAALRETAASLGIGPSSYAADAVRRALGSERRRPLPQPRSALTEAVREATGALGRVGNLINQVARRVHQGQPAQAAELATIRQALAAIDARLGAVLET